MQSNGAGVVLKNYARGNTLRSVYCEANTGDAANFDATTECNDIDLHLSIGAIPFTDLGKNNKVRVHLNSALYGAPLGLKTEGSYSAFYNPNAAGSCDERSIIGAGVLAEVVTVKRFLSGTSGGRWELWVKQDLNLQRRLLFVDQDGTVSFPLASGVVLLGKTAASASTPGTELLSGRVNLANAGTGTTIVTAYYNGSGTSPVGRVETSGGTTAQVNTSDGRLKQNVREISYDDAAQSIEALPAEWFEFISDPERTLPGFIAQKVRAACPAAAFGHEDDVDDHTGAMLPMGVDPTRLVPYLWAFARGALRQLNAVQRELAAMKK
jgi:hypothetical protein